MNLFEIQEGLENIKMNLWEYCEEGKTDIQKETKNTMNLLLDYIDLLIEEINEVEE